MFKNNTIKFEISISDNVDIYRDDIINEARTLLKEQIERNYSILIANTIREIVLEESKNHRKQLSANVEHWIRTMPSSELFFRDGFRKHIVDTAKTFDKELQEVIKYHINNVDTNKIYDALGNSIADRFYEFIRNER